MNGVGKHRTTACIRRRFPVRQTRVIRRIHPRRSCAVKHVLLGGLCLVFVALPASAQSDAQKKSTIAYIRKLQASDGGFRANARAQQSDLSAVNGALRILKYLGGEPRDKAACVAFVQKCFDKEGGGFA